MRGSMVGISYTILGSPFDRLRTSGLTPPASRPRRRIPPRRSGRLLPSPPPPPPPRAAAAAAGQRLPHPPLPHPQLHPVAVQHPPHTEVHARREGRVALHLRPEVIERILR